MKVGRPSNLFYMLVKRQVVDKDNSQLSDTGGRSQGNAIQINYVG